MQVFYYINIIFYVYYTTNLLKIIFLQKHLITIQKLRGNFLREIIEFIKEELLAKKHYLSSMEKEVPKAEGDEKLVFFFLLKMVMAARTMTVIR